MVGKDYDGKKIPPAIGPLGIRITRDRMQADCTDRSDEAEQVLRANLISQSICPPVFGFTDTPEVRRILGIPLDAPDTYSDKDFGPES